MCKSLTTRRLFPVLCFLASLACCDANGADDKAGSPPEPPSAAIGSTDEQIRIGLFYIFTETGKRHRDGIVAAFEEYKVRTSRDDIKIIEYPYSKQNDAVRMWRKATGLNGAKREIDIAIGPTESDAFLRMREESLTRIDETEQATETKEMPSPGQTDYSGELSDEATESAPTVNGPSSGNNKDPSPQVQVPVISGLVSADLRNEPTGWFFRTNVDVTARAQTLCYLINKYWINSIAVLYANTEFGRRAERAFAESLTSQQAERYMPLIYDSPPDPDKQLGRILAQRPEAVGFFGEREDIERIYRRLKVMNADSTSYTPFFFTLLDARETSASVDEIYYVSIADAETTEQPADAETTEQPDEEKKLDRQDDVVSLGHDTMWLVLRILDEMEPGTMTDARLTQFRDQLVNHLRRSDVQSGSWKKMRFASLENISRLDVYQRSKRAGSKHEDEPINLAVTYGLWTKFSHKVGLLFSIHGHWPATCSLVILAISGVLCWGDLRRLLKGSGKFILAQWQFYLMLGVQFSLAWVLYVFLAETGKIRYDNIFIAVTIALAPAALLRSTFFETEQGKAIGLKQLYDGWIQWLDRQLMKARFDSLEARVNVIAYNNSRFGMMAALKAVFRNHPSPAEGARLTQELEQAVAKEQDYFERRRECARHLLRQLSWEQLKAEGLVPPTCEDPPLDPRLVIRYATKHCAGKIEAVDKLVKKKLAEVEKKNPKRHAELQDVLKTEREVAVSSEGELNVNLRFLFVILGFNVQELIKRRLVSEQDIQEYRRRLAAQREKTKFLGKSRLAMEKLYAKLRQRIPIESPAATTPPDEAPLEPVAAEALGDEIDASAGEWGADDAIVAMDADTSEPIPKKQKAR